MGACSCAAADTEAAKTATTNSERNTWASGESCTLRKRIKEQEERRYRLDYDVF
jgi:hypothetical protein